MMLKLSRLKKNRVFMDNLRWDVTLEFLFKPRFVHSEKDSALVKETQGFMFYIDYMEDISNLMVLKTYHLRSKTIGQVDEVPNDLILNAAKKQGVKSVGGMYPIDAALEKWLKGHLGISD